MRLASTLMMILAAAASAQENAALPVLKAAIEAHGGAEALKKARTAKSSATGTMTLQGKEGTFNATAIYSTPEKYRMDVVAEVGGAKLTVSHILNGKKTRVTAKLNGTDLQGDPREKESTIQTVLLQDISTLTPLLDAKKYALKLEKDGEINGNSASVVTVTGNGLKEVKLYFDKKSNRLVKMQRRGFANGIAGIVEVNEEAYLSDFKPFEKALLPTATVVNHDGKKFMTMTVTEMKFLDKIDEKEFAID